MSFDTLLSKFKLSEKADEGKRRNYQQERYDVLNDDAEKYIGERISKRFRSAETRKDLARYLDLSNNAYKYIVQLLSIVYSEPPTRVFQTKDKNLQKGDTDLFSIACDEDYLDLQMERLNQITTALNECIIHPTIRNDRVEFDIILPQDCEVNGVGNTIYEIIYTIDDDNEYGASFEYWNEDERILISNDGHEVHREKNEIGTLPFVVYRRLVPVKGFWLGKNGDDLLESFYGQVMDRTYLSRVGYHQSYNQIFEDPGDINTPGVGQTENDPTFGPGHVPLGRYKTLDLRTDPRNYLETIEGKLKRTASNYGVSPEVLSQSKHNSGIERLISMASLLENRLKTIKYYRAQDMKLMHLVTLIYNTIPAGTRLGTFTSTSNPRIDYKEPVLIQSTLDRVKVLLEGMKAAVESPVDYILEGDPDIKTREDGLNVIERNIKEIGVVQEARRSFSVAVDGKSQDQINGESGGRPAGKREAITSESLRPSEDKDE